MIAAIEVSRVIGTILAHLDLLLHLRFILLFRSLSGWYVHEAQAAASKGGCSAGSCGLTDDQMSALPEHIREKVHNHPCYSEQAHHYFARMHVAVAPACNIQCHYCNRKYDCANESRPGVVSELLTPDQAVKKTMAVAANIPQMTVLGIAGPGDPLANSERTFETFRQLSEKAPDIKLCVSTNGLALPDAVEELSKHNIDHVTITINCVDPGIGAKIYPWVFWENRRIRGKKGAKILIDQQQKGLEMLIEKGILVKVNSVMTPGVNDEHLKEVSKIVKSKGAFLHNVMPLIAEAEHGTFYGVMGQRSPSSAELQDLQDACAGDMKIMRHCRQCRADAVGLLGEDRGAEFTMDKIENMEIDYAAAMEMRKKVHDGIAEELAAKEAGKQQNVIKLETGKTYRPVLMAVATSGGGVINQHFGHAREFLVYEASSDGVRFISHRKVDQYCEGDVSCGDGESVLQRTVRTLEGCEAVLCSKVGFEPWGMLEAAGIMPNNDYPMEPIEEAVMKHYKKIIDEGLVHDVQKRTTGAGVRSDLMALKIIESCVNCWACEPICPSKAIFEAKPHFLIDPKKCTECEGDYADPQCASICPIEGAILSSFGDALNPPGSLTGIPPAKLEAAMAEIQAR